MRGIKRRKSGSADRQLQKRTSTMAVRQDLPLVHITAVGNAREIVSSGDLEIRKCRAFQKELLYFFAVRLAYRLKDGDEKSHQINRFPFVFIVRPDALKTPYHVYPFDTGAAIKGVFDSQADPYIPLDDYELEPTLEAAARHIKWAFGSLEDYLEGNLRPDILDDVPMHETVTRGYVDIARQARTGSNKPDKRASAVEIAVNHGVPLKDNVLLAILPKQYLEEDGQPANDDFISLLEQRNVRWDHYDWQPNKTPNEFQQEINRVAIRFFKSQGLIR
ncbi:hypothetical protein [Bradyrhizobium aeschynomenes]|uniref:hypothetical protein n=1 Tax=Bradyrhizobium aeschynomenes TaxID=2734909 RepID=UPI0015547A00|nr:hypothetical protein [Bradyrhizobium aeschynomenes]NPV25394.1 hypothetical protein [Bradyrhizobium aeschynomenes]